MKKETSDNILQHKMEAFNQTKAMSTRNYQPVWARLEDKLHPKNKRKVSRFYFAAAAILLVILVGLIIRYQLNDQPQVHLVIQDLPIKKIQQILPFSVTADTFAHPAKPSQSKLILNNNSKKKITLSVPDNYNTGVILQNDEAIALNADLSNEVANTNFAEPPAVIIIGANTIVTAYPKKPTLKVLHINEIYNTNAIKPNETIKEPNVNWLFTTNNINHDIREADINSLPATRKKSFFSIPLQKQNSN